MTFYLWGFCFYFYYYFLFTMKVKAKGSRGFFSFSFFFPGRCFSARLFFFFFFFSFFPFSRYPPARAWTLFVVRTASTSLSLPLQPLWCSQMRFASLLLACLFMSLHLPLKFFAAGRNQETEKEVNTQRPRERFQSLVAGAQFDVRQDTGV